MYFVKIDTGGGKVVVAGDVDPEKLVKKIKMGGKHAEIWGGQNRNHQINPKFQNLQVDNNKVGRDSKSHARRVRKVVMVVEEVNVKVKLVSGRAKEARRSERGDQWLEERRSIAPTWI
ncbi:heavy metal-associated isoprenylated plant protein 32-like [Vigna radiata var. radiata]|uniref:Heavy metal-associated isoprenylated plant protein 32-like n=1 Tax=Vigna radiata var. radiata TaxID=3916 RepID=A0A3Q0FAW9_VIGRR|nr:heavy metal-associated isoprenylated plant protein 32-like [Vigna radiata var. radiata]